MSNIQNLWPQDFENVEIVMPKTILIQQAEFLGETTQQVVKGEVATNQVVNNNDLSDMGVIHELNIVAPALQNYKFTLIKVLHNMRQVYPLTLFYKIKDVKVKISSEAEFIDKLGELFSDPETVKIIRTLIAQSG